MAVPDWPLSFGGLNPSGWWSNWAVRLEHGHRLLAGFVALLVGVLCSAVWNNWWALVGAFAAGLVAFIGGSIWAVEKSVMAHLGIWPAAFAFIILLLRRRSFEGEEGIGRIERGLAIGAFFLVCIQASLGGLRVTRETEGFWNFAQVLRIFHGCVAQLFMMTLVALSARIARIASGTPGFSAGALVRPVCIGMGLVYCQLILGASMRHLGAGLAIPTFPAADTTGSWVPRFYDPFTVLNFLHTRVAASIVFIAVVLVIVRVWGISRELRGLRGLVAIAGLGLAVQVSLGVLVIWNQKPPTLTTFHVLVGAIILAALTAMAVQISYKPYSYGGRTQ